MKVIWAAEDITVGTVVGKPGIGERWLIGYFSYYQEDERYTLISLSDGMIQTRSNKEGLADRLTQSGLLPAALL